MKIISMNFPKMRTFVYKASIQISKTREISTIVLAKIKPRSKTIKLRILKFNDFYQLEKILETIENDFKIKLSQRYVEQLLLYLLSHYPINQELLSQKVFEIPFQPIS